MRSKMRFKLMILKAILLGLILLSFLRAGVTGKIAGRIIDVSNGEPVPYVNVYIENGSLGASTDEEGYYAILNLPPGTYTVTAYAVGYIKMSVTNVKVSIDLTTKVNFNFRQAVLESSETVVVEAERPIITRDLTATTAVVSSEDFEALPVTEFQEILQIQAGVIGGHVRGGRSGEVVYAIDGMPVTDTFDGSTVIDVNTSAIQELQFVSGAFNAEYGKALSGYVNIATKEAGDKFEAGITSYMGDYLSNHTDIFRGIDRFNVTSIHDIEGFVSTPVVKDKLSFYGNVRYIYFGGWMNGKKVFNPWDITINKGPSEPIEQRYEIQASGDGSYVPMNWNRKINAHAKWTYKPFAGLKLNYNLMMEKVAYRDYDHAFSYNPDGDFKRFRNGFTNILGITHVINESAFYQLNVAYFSKEYKHYVYKNPYDSRYTHYDLLNQQPQDVPSFLTGGTKSEHYYRKTNTLTAKLDVTSQITKRHQLKGGVDFSLHKLSYKRYSLLQEPGLPRPAESGNPFVKTHIPDPVDPSENLSIDRYTRRPREISAYLQDKIEFDQLIINLGLRYDIFLPDGKILSDPTDPDIYRPRRPENIARTPEERKSYWYKAASTKSQFSPRLGVSFPFSSNGVFHFSYGHFFQIPNFELLYQNPEYKFAAGTGNLGIAGNPDLSPEQTINGEVGFSYGLNQNILIDVTGYFRDIRNLAGTRADEINMFGGSGSYSQLVNSDFGFVRGIVFTLDKRFSNNWSAKIDYTYQIAKGNASDPAATRNQRVSGEEPEIQLIRLNFDQTHTFNATFKYVSSKQWGLSLIGNYGSGMPYTPTESINVSKLLTNTGIKPALYNMDLKAYKTLTFTHYIVTFFARIYNLFDVKNQVNVYTDTGTANFTLEEYLRKQQHLPALVNTMEEYYRIPYYYSEPRRLEFGLAVQFTNR